MFHEAWGPLAAEHKEGLSSRVCAYVYAHMCMCLHYVCAHMCMCLHTVCTHMRTCLCTRVHSSPFPFFYLPDHQNFCKPPRPAPGGTWRDMCVHTGTRTLRRALLTAHLGPAGSWPLGNGNPTFGTTPRSCRCSFRGTEGGGGGDVPALRSRRGPRCPVRRACPGGSRPEVRRAQGGHRQPRESPRVWGSHTAGGPSSRRPGPGAAVTRPAG